MPKGEFLRFHTVGPIDLKIQIFACFIFQISHPPAYDQSVLFPKGECLSTHRVGPLGLNGYLHLGLLFGFLPPYEP